MKSIRISSGALALLSCLAFAVPASAGDSFQMIGSWLQRRGNAVQIPALPVQGVPANTIITQTGASPRTINIPTGAFKRTAAPGGTNVVPVPVPSLAQLATNFDISGPAATTLQGQPGNVLQANAWQLTRPNASFNWCPGATNNPNCANRDSSIPAGGMAPAGSGTYHGIIRYSNTNPNRFGGTMQIVLSTANQGPGAVGRNFGPTQVAHFPVSGMGRQVMGGRYTQPIDTNYLSAPPITVPVSRTSAMGVILQGGPQVGTFGTGTTNRNFGMPWTTGLVVASGSNGGAVTQTIWSFSGSDGRTSMGAGNITLVSGGLGQRLGLGLTFVNADTISMTLAAPGTVPAMTPAVAAGAALLMLGVGFALRKRLF